MSLLVLLHARATRSVQAAIVAVLALFIALVPAASAGPVLVVDVGTRQVIVAEEAGEPWYPASLTKLMTAYLAFDALREGRLSLDQKIPVSEAAARVQPSKIGFKAGATVSVDFALQALLVYSANDMAVVLAEAVGGNVPDFVARMNATAGKLGMSGTSFANPHGLFDSRQVTTARDIAVLALALQNDFPQHRHYFGQGFLKVGKKSLRNRNMLLRQMPAADGMKTGYICDSGFNLAATATIDNNRYLAIILGAKTAKGRADIAQVLLEEAARRRGQYAGAAEVTQVRNRTGTGPTDMSDVVCKGKDRVTWAAASQLGGWGASFGRFADPNAADALLAGRLATTRSLFSGGDSGVVRVPGSKEVVALVWSLEQKESLALCSWLRKADDHCEVIPPEAFAEFARQASLAAQKKASGKSKNKKAKASGTK